MALERLLLATDGAGVGTYDLDLESGSGYWSPRAFALLGMNPNPEGTAEFEDWLDRIHEEDREEVLGRHQAAATRGGAWQATFRIIRADDGQARWLETHGLFTRNPDGHTRSTGVVADITEKMTADASLRESESRLRRSQQAGGIGNYEWLMDGSGGTQSEEMLRLIGLKPTRKYSFKQILETVLPEDREQVFATVATIQRGSSKRETFYRVRNGEEIRWIRDLGQLERDDNGRPYRWVGIVQDVTKQKRHEEAQRSLVNELNHRVKNTLAVVQAIAHQTFRADVAPEVARSAFEGRLISLAAAHDILTKENWGPVSILHLVNAAANALSIAADRLETSGTELMLSSKAALAMSIALHELGTNAIKFGGLKGDAGKVRISWTSANDEFHFIWEEEGGPPPLQDRGRGFGTRMIKHALAAELKGSVEWQFKTSGVRCVVTAPLDENT